jgi:hypothetical protein
VLGRVGAAALVAGFLDGALPFPGRLVVPVRELGGDAAAVAADLAQVVQGGVDALLGVGLAVAVLGAGGASGGAGVVAGALAVEVLQVSAAEGGDLPAGGALEGSDRLREVAGVGVEIFADDAGARWSRTVASTGQSLGQPVPARLAGLAGPGTQSGVIVKACGLVCSDHGFQHDLARNSGRSRLRWEMRKRAGVILLSGGKFELGEV